MGQFLTGSRKHAITEIAFGDTPYPITDAEPDYIIVDSAGGPVTVVLPTLADNQGRLMRVKNAGSAGNAVTLDGEGAETIDGELTQVIYDGECLWVFAQSSEWSAV